MTTQTKTCFKCKATKPITEFYVHPQMGDGRLNKCKTCARKDVNENYQANVERYRAYDKARSVLPHRVKSRNEPCKVAAHNAVRSAMASGALVRQPCEVCGRAKTDAHHDDYTKPLAVRWLCRSHHAEWHANNDPIRPAQDAA